MKKFLAILIIAAVVLGIIISKNNYLDRKPQVNTSSEPSWVEKLPQNWSEIKDTKAVVKLEKKVEKGLKPQIVLIKSSSKEAADPAKYVNRLIAGARSAVSGLRVSSDKRNQEGEVYTSLLSGYYYNQKYKIDLLQRIYVKGEDIYTLTASYNGNMSDELNQILDMVVKEKISL